MRRLLDPYGTLGSLTIKLTAQVSVILFFGLLTIPVSFVVPARFGTPAMLFLSLPVNPCLSFGMNSLKKVTDPRGGWAVWPIWLGVSILLAWALLAWLDYATHTLPAHLGFSSPILAKTPFFRDIAGFFMSIAVFSASMLIARARHASQMLAGQTPAAQLEPSR